MDEGAAGVRSGVCDKQIDLLLEYEDFLCDDWPHALQDELQHDVEEQLGIHDLEVKERAVDVVRNVQLRLLYSFLNKQEKHEDVDETNAVSPTVTPSTALAPLEGSDLENLRDILSLDFTLDTGADELRWLDTTWISTVQADQQEVDGATIPNLQNVDALPPLCETISANLDGVVQEDMPLPAQNPEVPNIKAQDQGGQHHLRTSARFRQRKKERDTENQRKIEKLEADNRELRQRVLELTGESPMDRYQPLHGASQGLYRLADLPPLEIPSTNSSAIRPPSPWATLSMTEPYSFPSPPVLGSFPNSPSPYQPGSPYRLPNSNTPPPPLHSVQVAVPPISQGARGSPGYESGYSSPGSISSSFAGQRIVDAKLQCMFPGCTAGPFSTAYLLKSHTLVHSAERKYYCGVKDCPRSEVGIGFKRMNELKRHNAVHSGALYYCPFCPGKSRWFPRPDNLQRFDRLYSFMGVEGDQLTGVNYSGMSEFNIQTKRKATQPCKRH